MIRLAEHPLQQRRSKGKALGVRVKAAPAEPKSSAPDTTDTGEKRRSALEELTAEHV
jgi:hypothetical protein